MYIFLLRSLNPFEWVVFGGPSGDTLRKGGTDTQIKTVKNIIPHPDANLNVTADGSGDIKPLFRYNLALIELQVTKL